MTMTREEIAAKLNSISKPASGWLEDAKFRVENQDWLERSQKIALKILRTLRAQGKNQTDLAEALNVSPQQVNKWVKGKENFTLETICKINAALGIDVLSDKVETPNVVSVVQEYVGIVDRLIPASRRYSKRSKIASKYKVLNFDDYALPTKLAR